MQVNGLLLAIALGVVALILPLVLLIELGELLQDSFHVFREADLSVSYRLDWPLGILENPKLELLARVLLLRDERVLELLDRFDVANHLLSLVREYVTTLNFESVYQFCLSLNPSF